MNSSPRSSDLRITLVSAVFLLLLISFPVFNIFVILLYRPDLTWLNYDHESESLIEATRVPKIISSEASSLPTDVHTFQDDGDVTVGINAPRHPVFDILEHANEEWETLLTAHGGDQAQAVVQYHRLQRSGKTRSAPRAITSLSSLDLFTPISPSLLSSRQRQVEILPDTFTLVIRSGVPSIIYGNLTASVSEKHRIRRVELLLNAIRSFSNPLPDLHATFNLLSHPRHALHSQTVEFLGALLTDRSLPNSPVKFRSQVEPSAMDPNQGRTIHADDLKFLESIMTTQERWSWENACHAQLDVEEELEEEDERNDITPPIKFVASPEARSDPCVHRSLAELHPSYQSTNFIYHTHISPVISETTAPWASDILSPPLDFFDSDYQETGSAIPWENKTAGLFWRDHASGVSALHSIAQWQLLVELKSEQRSIIIPTDSEGFLIDRKRLMDVTTFDFIQEKGDAEERGWKFLIELGGGAQMRTKMASGSLVFRPLLFGDWVSEHSVPWVHYVPVQPDLSDLPSLTAFFERHDALALRIAKAGQTWAREELGQVRVRDSLRQILEEWAKLGFGLQEQ